MVYLPLSVSFFKPTNAFAPSINSEPSSTEIPLGARTVNVLPVSVTCVEKVSVTALGAVRTVEFTTGSALSNSKASASEALEEKRSVKARKIGSRARWIMDSLPLD